MQYELSSYGKKSTFSSPVNKMMRSFAEDFREDIDINLGVGYVNENTIPRTEIARALKTVLDNPAEYPFSLNYGAAKGSKSLREILKKKLHLPQDRSLVIGANGATSLLEAFATIHKPGIIVTSDPWYYIYCNYLLRLGFEILSIPEDANGIDTEILSEKISSLGERQKEIRFFYIVSVANPSSVIISDERKLNILKEAEKLSLKLKRKVPVILDRAYEELIHNPNLPKPSSPVASDKLGLLFEIGSLSKIIAPALRIGFLSGKDSEIIKAISQRTNDAGFSASLLLQYSSILLLEEIDPILKKTQAAYHEKSRQINKKINEKLGDFIENISGGDAGFYFYITFKNISTDTNSRLYNFLARTTGYKQIDYDSEGIKKPRVIFLPGEFTVNPEGELFLKGKKQLRLSYAFEKTENILKAVDLIHEAINYSIG